MSKVNIVPNEYIGSVELNRFQEFISEGAPKVILKMLIKRFGHDPSVIFQQFGSLYMGYAGVGKMYLSAGVAVDSDLNLIVNRERYEFEVPVTATPGSAQYVLVSYDTTNTEVGTVNIGTDGSMIGSGTEFLKTLRGYPGQPLSVRFPNSKLNLGEYPISEVLSNDSALINAIGLYQEAGLQYEVLGAFPSDGYVSHTDKKIFIHDSFKLEVYPFLPSDVDKRIPVALLSYDAAGDLIGFRDLRPDYTISL